MFENQLKIFVYKIVDSHRRWIKYVDVNPIDNDYENRFRLDIVFHTFDNTILIFLNLSLLYVYLMLYNDSKMILA